VAFFEVADFSLASVVGKGMYGVRDARQTAGQLLRRQRILSCASLNFLYRGCRDDRSLNSPISKSDFSFPIEGLDGGFGSGEGVDGASGFMMEGIRLGGGLIKHGIAGR